MNISIFKYINRITHMHDLFMYLDVFSMKFNQFRLKLLHVYLLNDILYNKLDYFLHAEINLV